jgi:hypothetical protein
MNHHHYPVDGVGCGEGQVFVACMKNWLLRLSFQGTGWIVVDEHI